MIESFTYDAAGNLQARRTSTARRRPTRTTVNRLLARCRTAASTSLRLASPTLNRAAPFHDRRQRSTNYAYDLRDRLLQKPPQGTLNYTWDAAGDFLTVRSSNTNGTSVNYSYDELNRLSTVTDNRLSGLTSYTYDPAGNLRATLTRTASSTVTPITVSTASPTCPYEGRLHVGKRTRSGRPGTAPT